jgi:hypothetical protein
MATATVTATVTEAETATVTEAETAAETETETVKAPLRALSLPLLKTQLLAL